MVIYYSSISYYLQLQWQFEWYVIPMYHTKTVFHEHYKIVERVMEKNSHKTKYQKKSYRFVQHMVKFWNDKHFIMLLAMKKKATTNFFMLITRKSIHQSDNFLEIKCFDIFIFFGPLNRLQTYPLCMNTIHFYLWLLRNYCL